MIGLLELHAADGDPFLLNVETIERVDTVISGHYGVRTLIRTISGDYLYPKETYAELLALLRHLAGDNDPTLQPPPVDLSIPPEWKAPLPRLQDE